MSNLAAHVRRELELIGEEPEVVEGMVLIAEQFAETASSGGAAAILLPTLYELLQFNNLYPLTDNPAEWHHHSGDTVSNPEGMWQNIRNSSAFSNDGGKTYWKVSDGSYDGHVVMSYTSRSYAELLENQAMRDVVEVEIDREKTEYPRLEFDPENPEAAIAEHPIEVEAGISEPDEEKSESND